MLGKIQLTDLQKEKIEEYTFSCYPEEMCGFLTKDDFVPVQNCAEDKLNSFKISDVDTAKWFSKAIAIVHSHTRELKKQEVLDLRTPSYADFENQKRTGKPWLIVGCESLTVTESLQFPRTQNCKYEGRRFQWFINDCYNLVEDFYLFELGITLKERVVTEDYTQLRSMNNIFEQFISDYGFKEIPFEQLQENDLVLLDSGGFVSNHLGIFTKGQILHQGMVSAYVPFETFLGRINKVLRYVGEN
jgi:proteasome lid subunit RPN8/RPN11